MILEIDTEQHLIKVKGTVSLKELFKTLSRLFPDFEWEDYAITDELYKQDWHKTFEDFQTHGIMPTVVNPPFYRWQLQQSPSLGTPVSNPYTVTCESKPGEDPQGSLTSYLSGLIKR